MSDSGYITACATCGTVHEELGALQATITKQAQEIGGLKRSLNKATRTGPVMTEIGEVFEYWKVTLGKRSDVTLGPKRIEAVRARLRDGFTVERLKRAIDGCATDDWAMGRVAKTRGQTFNDLAKHICLNEESVERFEDMVLKPKPKPATAGNVVPIRSDAVSILGPDPLDRPLDRAVLALRREYGVDVVRASWGSGFRAEEWWSPCPLHPGAGEATPMRVRERGNFSSSLDVQCADGCLPSMVLEAIRSLEEKREEAMAA